MVIGYKRIKRMMSMVASIEEDIKEEPEVDMGTVATTDMVEEAVYPPHVSTTVGLVMSHDFSLSCVFYVYIFIVLNMQSMIVPT
jgi:hypothetical protein